MTTINIHAAKTNLSKLVDQAAAGDEIIIARAGKPVARLMPAFRRPSDGERPDIAHRGCLDDPLRPAGHPYPLIRRRFAPDGRPR